MSRDAPCIKKPKIKMYKRGKAYSEDLRVRVGEYTHCLKPPEISMSASFSPVKWRNWWMENLLLSKEQGGPRSLLLLMWNGSSSALLNRLLCTWRKCKPCCERKKMIPSTFQNPLFLAPWRIIAEFIRRKWFPLIQMLFLGGKLFQPERKEPLERVVSTMQSVQQYQKGQRYCVQIRDPRITRTITTKQDKNGILVLKFLWKKWLLTWKSNDNNDG